MQVPLQHTGAVRKWKMIHINKNGVKLYTFREHDLTISGEESHLRQFAELARDEEGTIGDLRYKIEEFFDIDGISSEDTETVESMDIKYPTCDMCELCADEYLDYAERKFTDYEEWRKYLKGSYCRKCKRLVFVECDSCHEQINSKLMVIPWHKSGNYRGKLICKMCLDKIRTEN